MIYFLLTIIVIITALVLIMCWLVISDLRKVYLSDN